MDVAVKKFIDKINIRLEPALFEQFLEEGRQLTRQEVFGRFDLSCSDACLLLRTDACPSALQLTRGLTQHPAKLSQQALRELASRVSVRGDFCASSFSFSCFRRQLPEKRLRRAAKQGASQASHYRLGHICTRYILYMCTFFSNQTRQTPLCKIN